MATAREPIRQAGYISATSDFLHISFAYRSRSIHDGLSALSTSAQAQTLCVKRGEVAGKLKEKYKEAPVSMGLSNSGTIVEVFVSEKGSFTIVMTHPNGLACLMAAGESWEQVDQDVMDTGV